MDMKILNKIAVVLLSVLLPVGFAGCSDDEVISNEDKAPDFIIGQDVVKVKIGSENKVTLNVEQGGGEYNAFILDENIAKMEMVDGSIHIEGIVNGQTSLIVSDKYNRYRRIPISVYTVDALQLGKQEMEIVTRLGYPGTLETTILSGNGGYKVSSDNSAVEISLDEVGLIYITATSKKEDYTANITVTDCSGLSAKITVNVKATLIPFSDEELEDIMSKTEWIYVLNDKQEGWGDEPVREKLENGKIRYGWIDEFWGRIYGLMYFDFLGGTEVGEKEEAVLTYQEGKLFTFEKQPVVLEVIKNDGTNLWVVYSFVNEREEKLYYGYFCDELF